MIAEVNKVWAVVHYVAHWEEDSYEQERVQIFTNSDAAYAYAVECYLKEWMPLKVSKKEIQEFLKLSLEEAYRCLSDETNEIWNHIMRAPEQKFLNIELISDNGVPQEELYEWAEQEEYEQMEFEAKRMERELYCYRVKPVSIQSSWCLPTEWNVEHWNTALQLENQEERTPMSKTVEETQEEEVMPEVDDLLQNHRRLLAQMEMKDKELSDLREILHLSSQKIRRLQQDKNELEEQLLREQSRE